MAVPPEGEIGARKPGGVVLTGEVAAGGSDGVAPVADELGARGRHVSAVKRDAVEPGAPHVPAFGLG